MDIYKILETLKQVEEGQMKHHMWDMAERLNLADFLEMFPDDKDFYLGVHGVDSEEELDQDKEPSVGEGHELDDLIKQQQNVDQVYNKFNRGGYNKLTPQTFKDKIDFIDRQLKDPSQRPNYEEFKQRRSELVQAALRAGILKEGEKKGLYYYVNKRKKAGTSRPKDHPKAPSAQDWKDAAKTAKKESMETESKFTFANPKQKPGDQVRGTEVAKKKKSGEHPFKGRLVGAAESYEHFLDEIIEPYGATKTPPAKPDPKEIAKDQTITTALRTADPDLSRVSQSQMVSTVNKGPGQPQSSQDIKNLIALGGTMKKIIDKGDPNFAKGPLAQQIRKATAGGVQ